MYRNSGELSSSRFHHFKKNLSTRKVNAWINFLVTKKKSLKNLPWMYNWRVIIQLHSLYFVIAINYNFLPMSWYFCWINKVISTQCH